MLNVLEFRLTAKLLNGSILTCFHLSLCRLETRISILTRSHFAVLHEQLLWSFSHCGPDKNNHFKSLVKLIWNDFPCPIRKRACNVIGAHGRAILHLQIYPPSARNMFHQFISICNRKRFQNELMSTFGCSTLTLSPSIVTLLSVDIARDLLAFRSTWKHSHPTPKHKTR